MSGQLFFKVAEPEGENEATCPLANWNHLDRGLQLSCGPSHPEGRH